MKFLKYIFLMFFVLRFGVAADLDDINFHHCVSTGLFQTDRRVVFCPPDEVVFQLLRWVRWEAVVFLLFFSQRLREIKNAYDFVCLWKFRYRSSKNITQPFHLTTRTIKRNGTVTVKVEVSRMFMRNFQWYVKGVSVCLRLPIKPLKGDCDAGRYRYIPGDNLVQWRLSCCFFLLSSFVIVVFIFYCGWC